MTFEFLVVLCRGVYKLIGVNLSFNYVLSFMIIMHSLSFFAEHNFIPLYNYDNNYDSLLYIVMLFTYLVNLCSVEKWNKIELNWIELKRFRTLPPPFTARYKSIGACITTAIRSKCVIIVYLWHTPPLNFDLLDVFISSFVSDCFQPMRWISPDNEEIKFLPFPINFFGTISLPTSKIHLP